MDSFSADLSNSVLNNSLEDAVLEITFGGCKLEFLKRTEICISGGDFYPMINNKAIQLNTKIVVDKNSILTFKKVNYGVRCYLAVKGGLQSELKLKSRSFYQNITKSCTISKNELINYQEIKDDFKESYTSIKSNKQHFESTILQCFKGPEFYLLNETQKQLLEKGFVISKDNNRMGYKLNEIIKNDLPQILTSAVLPGTVQLTPSGKLIVLMRDCQVTGGYPRILQLTENSINKLAQKSTGNKINFQF